MAHGGMDPVVPKSLQCGRTATLLHDLVGHPDQRRTPGGSVFLEYHNFRLPVLWDMERANPTGETLVPVTDGEVIGARRDQPIKARMEAQIQREWSAIQKDPGELGDWIELFTSRRKRRRSQLAPEPIADAGAGGLEPWEGIWGSSCQKHLVLDPQAMAYMSLKWSSLGSDKLEEAMRADAGVEVRNPVPDRKEEQTSVDQRDLQGCGAAPQNLCLQHAVPDNLREAIASLMALQTSYKRLLGTTRAKRAGDVVAFIGDNGGAVDKTSVTRFFLLIDVRTNPEVQYYTPVILDNIDAGGPVDVLRFPLDAHLGTGPPRMATLGLPIETVTIKTGGEIALELLLLKRCWRLHPTSFEWSPGPNLLLLKLKGTDAAFEPLKPQRRRKPPTFSVDELLRQDPWDAGERATTTCGAAAEPMDMPHAGDLADDYSDSLLGGFEGDDAVAHSDVDLGGIGEDEEDNELEEPPEREPDCGGNGEPPPHEDDSDTDAEALRYAFRQAPLPPPPTPAPPTPPGRPPSPEPPPPDTGTEVGPHDRRRRAPPAPAAAPRLAAPRMAVARGSNWIDIHGFEGAVLKGGDRLVGYSVRCPVCGDNKYLHWVKSGMSEEDAKLRLSIWARECGPDHRYQGGRLLKDCVRGT
jgi:hypothetical protein